MNVLDLFSGIGGFSLGLERAGMRTVAFCEIEPYPRAVLKKHWPHVPCYDDVRTLTAERLAADGIAIDVICGGFPCQDISLAGKGAGLAGERSGLWREYARLIGELRPRFVVVENVAALLGRGLSRVLGDLTEIGYDAEWYCIQPKDIGIPAVRDRVWICAYPAEINVAQVVATPRLSLKFGGVGAAHISMSGWAVDFKQMGCGADGVPDHMGEFEAYGNAVVPQIPEIIGRAIMRAEGLSA